MKTITVIVPVYNVEKYLCRCIDSILAQSFVDFELLLIDDGSTDASGEMCDHYREKDGRIRVLHQDNGGAAAARNAGLDSARGEWIAFVDSDDWVHPDYFHLLLEAAIKNRADIVACRYQLVYNCPEGFDKEWQPIFSNEDREEYWVNDRIGAVVPWGKLYRHDLFNEIRYPVGRTAEDEFVTHRLLFECKTLVVLNNKLYYYYYDNTGSVTHSNYLKRMRDSQEALYQHIEYFKNTPWQRAYREEIGYYAETWAIAIRATERINSKESKRQRAKYKDELRKCLLEYSGFIPEKKLDILYAIAYPSVKTFMKKVSNRIRSVIHE